MRLQTEQASISEVSLMFASSSFVTTVSFVSDMFSVDASLLDSPFSANRGLPLRPTEGGNIQPRINAEYAD